MAIFVSCGWPLSRLHIKENWKLKGKRMMKNKFRLLHRSCSVQRLTLPCKSTVTQVLSVHKRKIEPMLGRWFLFTLLRFLSSC